MRALRRNFCIVVRFYVIRRHRRGDIGVPCIMQADRCRSSYARWLRSISEAVGSTAAPTGGSKLSLAC